MKQSFTTILQTTTQTNRWYAQQLLTKSLLLLLLLLGMIGTTKAQEGTKQLMPNATDRLIIRLDPFANYGADAHRRLNIYLNIGEKMHFGMRLNTGAGVKFRIKDAGGNIVFTETSVPTAAGAGYIGSYTQAVAGPNGVKLNGSTITTGYATAFVHTATSSGNHYIEFTGDSGAELLYFDVTVTDATNNIITNPDNPNKSAGRLWSEQWSLSTKSFTEFPVNAEFFVFTADEFVNRVKYEMKPYDFEFVANSFGTSITGEQIVQQQSKEGNVLGTTNIGEYKIFLNDPDQTAFPTNNLPPPVVKAWLDNTKLYDFDYTRTPQQLDLSANKPVITKNTGTCPDPSSATFMVESNVEGRATILIDANGDGFVVGTNDRALYMDITPGVNRLVWDLKDANGNDLSDGNFSASATFLSRGPAHFPLYDVESLSGITTSSVRPFNKLDPTLYWDDSNIADWADKSGTNAMAVTTQRQLVIGSTTPRVWTYSNNNSENNNGNRNTMNSWFNAIDLGLAGFDFTIVESSTQCNNGSLPVVSDIYKEGAKNVDVFFLDTDFTKKYSDPGNASLNKIQILSLPSAAEGVFKLSGGAITLNQEISFADLSNITFSPATNFTGTVSIAWNGNNGSNFAAASANINIVINTAPTISNINNDAVCAGGSTGTINFTVADAETAAGSLTVTASSSNLTVVPIANIVLGGSDGNRTVVVTPAAGQSGASTITIFVSDGSTTSSTSFIVTAGPSSNFTGSTSACVGSALSLTADEAGATSYSWKKDGTEVGTAQTFSIASMAASNEGNYSLTVMNNGCTSTKSFVISVFPKVGFTGTTSVCVGSTLSLTANETVATSYSWKKGSVEVSTSQTLTINNMQAANAGNDYTLTVVKEGCTNTSPAFSIAVTGPTANITNGATAQYCAGGSVTLTATAVTGATYQWKKNGVDILNATNATYDASTAGTYTVVVTTTCANTSGGTVVSQTTPPTANITNGATAQYCTNSTVTLTATTVAGATYQWKKDGVDILNATNATYDVGAAGKYTVVVTQGSCSATSAETTVSENVVPVVGITNGASVTFCGTSGVLTATSVASATYQWKKDGTNIGTDNNQLTVTEAGAYTVTATIGSCVQTSATTTVSFNSIPSSSVSITSDATNHTVCAGQNISFTATPVNGGAKPAYQWHINGNNVVGANQSTFTSNSLNNNDAVSVTMTASLTCAQPVTSNEITVTINALPTVTFVSNNATISNGEVTINENESVTINLTGGASYTWSTTGGGIQSQSTDGAEVVLAPTETTTYTITTTNAAGCTSTEVYALKVIVIPNTSLFIPSLFSPNGDGQNDRFVIRGSGIEKITFRVFDRSGHLIYESNSVEEAMNNGWDGTKNGVKQPIGMYTWSIIGSFAGGRKLTFKGASAGKINLLR